MKRQNTKSIRSGLGHFAVAAVISLGLSSHAQAANCQSAYNQFSDIWKDVEPVLHKIGCDTATAAAVATGQLELVPLLTQCAKILGGRAELRKAFVNAWNDNVHNWSKIGARTLPIGESAKGTIVSTAGRMFVTPESIVEDSVKIVINEKDGKNKTSVVYCVFDGKTRSERATKWFNDTKDRKKDKSERREVTIDTFGKILTVHLDGKSAANKFKYSISSSAN